MNKTEAKVVNNFTDLMENQKECEINLSVRDSIEAKYYPDEDLRIIKYKLWDSEIFKYYKSKNEENIFISFCGYDTRVTRQRLRIFEDTFNFEINNIGTRKYELKYLNNSHLLEDKISYEEIYKIDLRNRVLSILR